MSAGRISVEVVNYSGGGEGPYRAGMAVVTLDGNVIAKLRTGEGIEFTISDPQVSTRTTRPAAMFTAPS